MGLWLWLARLLRPGWLWKHLRRTLEELCEAVPPSIAADIRETADRERRFRPLAEAFARLLAYEGWLTARDQLTNLESRLAQMPTAERLSQEIRDAKRAKAEASTAWLREAWTAHVTSQQQKVRDRLAAYFDQNEQLHGTRGAEFARRLDALTYTIRELGESLPIWIVTNLSARRSLPLKPAMFDLVVIDEASQCDIASALPLLFRTKRAVIIGDPHQLRHITMLPDREEQDLARRHQVVELLDDWSYNRQSLYDLAARTHRRSGGEPTFLREHFRSWPLIAEFSNRAVYQSRLRLRTDLRQLQDRLNGRQLGIVWHQVRGIVPSTQRSAGNPTEAKAVLELLQSWWDSGFLQRPDLRFGIVTPFRRQVEHIGDALRRQLWWEEIRGRLILGTAHQFQGDECDVMVFSPVVSAGMRENTKKWLTSTEHLLNVAITRARGVLHVVGDRQACEAAGGLLGEFSTYVNEMSAPPPSAAGNPIQTRMAELLAGSGLWYCPQFPVGRDRFDFLVVSPLGTRYDLEVDGRHHRTPEQIHADQVRDKRVAAAGYDVIRISARDLTAKPDRVQERIARLV
jgi:very-short-patch-repair endonuclease